jgi:GTP-binding protein
MEWLGENGVPFSIVFTKIDKLSSNELNKNTAKYKKKMLQTWEEMPKTFVTSSESKIGRLDILNYIDQLNDQLAGEIRKLF